MKKKLFLILSVFSLAGFSQNYQLTQTANEPIVGDSSQYYLTDTSNYLSGLPISITGTNCVWNYSNLIGLLPMITTTFVSPATLSNSPNYPGCTVVQKQGNTYNFLKSVNSPTNQTELLGVISNTIGLNFSNSAIVAKYPMGYGSNFTDNVSGSFTYSVNGTFTGSVSTSVDGYGVLQLPGGVIVGNVLRVKNIQNINLFLGIIPLGNALQYTYSYFHASQKFPLLSVSYTRINLVGSNPTFGATITGNSKTLMVGLTEYSDELLNLTVFPNPAGQELNVKFTNSSHLECRVELIDHYGQIIYQEDLGNFQEINAGIMVGHIKKGLYFLHLINGSQNFGRKVFIEGN